MSEDLPTEARPASPTDRVPSEPDGALAPTDGDTSAAPGAAGNGAPRRRRRRGSRGGRNRRKPGTAGANGAGTDDADDADDDLSAGEDYTDAAADRGLTTDDVAEVAREESGLRPAAPPRICLLYTSDAADE